MITVCVLVISVNKRKSHLLCIYTAYVATQQDILHRISFLFLTRYIRLIMQITTLLKLHVYTHDIVYHSRDIVGWYKPLVLPADIICLNLWAIPNVLIQHTLQKLVALGKHLHVHMWHLFSQRWILYTIYTRVLLQTLVRAR